MSGGYSKTLSATANTAVVSISGWEKPAIAFSRDALAEIISELEAIQDNIQAEQLSEANYQLHLMWESIKASISMLEYIDE